MRSLSSITVFVAAATFLPAAALAQSSGSDRHPGSAVVREKGGDGEALVRIECDVASQPEAGFITEPNRITRRETGRSNMGSVRLRPWKDTDDVLITTSWGAAWVPRPTSSGGVLTMQVDVGPVSFVRDNMPVAVTYEMWKAGDIPSERTTVELEANCNERDPDAPAWRRIGSP